MPNTFLNIFEISNIFEMSRLRTKPSRFPLFFDTTGTEVAARLMQGLRPASSIGRLTPSAAHHLR
jgi:hypothetical protein